jgi:hypothetical protein
MNEAGDDFILTPIYDALKAFSQMFPAGSKVIRCEISSDQVAAVARKVGKGYEVVVANVSDDDKNQDVIIRIGDTEKQISLKKLEIKKLKF